MNKPLGRHDLELIRRKIEYGSRVLDLGCGNGDFLRSLQEEKNVTGLGLEIDQRLIAECIANGVSVIQSNLDRPLDFAEDLSFDVVVLSHTLQVVQKPDRLLREIVRVGKKAIVSFINFGFIANRLQLMFTGHMPRNKYVPYTWYNTPNIHLGTIEDFRDLCKELDIVITCETATGQNWDAPANMWHNLFAPGCVFELTKE